MVRPQVGRVGLLVRISDDREDVGIGVDRQETDARALAGRDWPEAECRLFRENDTTAFRRRRVVLPDGRRVLRVVRPVFREALRQLAEGEIDALVAYNLDRVPATRATWRT